MRFRLRTLLIVLAIGPPVIAGVWFLAQSALGATVLAFVLYFIASLFLAPDRSDRVH